MGYFQTTALLNKFYILVCDRVHGFITSYTNGCTFLNHVQILWFCSKSNFLDSITVSNIFVQNDGNTMIQLQCFTLNIWHDPYSNLKISLPLHFLSLHSRIWMVFLLISMHRVLSFPKSGSFVVFHVDILTFFFFFDWYIIGYNFL